VKRLTIKARAALIAELLSMPEETFGYFVAWARGQPINYPDGLGGFREESRDAVLELRKAAGLYAPTDGD
jgi:hypothetical protein